MRSLASLSGRTVEPAREIPANSPRAREYVSISARIVTSVSAAALRPTGTGRDRSVAAQLDLAGEDGVRAAVIHHQDDEVRRLSADLESDAGAFEGHHGRRAPRTAEMFAAAAGHHTASVARADDEMRP